jgi:CRP-like cAMP-binding protein
VDKDNFTNRISNRILKALPESVLERLAPILETVVLTSGTQIYRYNEKIRQIYFPESGLISMVKTMQDGRTVEVGVVGRDGVTGANALFGVDRAFLESVVQIPGRASRIDCAVLQREVAGSESSHDLFQRYALYAIGELVQTAGCNRLHTLEERCARWLLIAHDCANSDRFPLTHEYLAMMLGVRRSGVSLAANVFKHADFIRYRRGWVTVVDRSGLESVACECYAANRSRLDSVFRPARELVS